MKTNISYNMITSHTKYSIMIFKGCNDTIFSFNNVINNSQSLSSQALDNGTNSIFEHNYWDDWVTPDNNNDSIVDQPYLIDGEAHNQDDFPHVSEFGDTNDDSDDFNDEDNDDDNDDNDDNNDDNSSQESTESNSSIDSTNKNTNFGWPIVLLISSFCILVLTKRNIRNWNK